MLIGVEGGHLLLPGSEEEQLAHLKAFADRGVRYLTLSWSSSSPIGGSTAEGQQQGLTDFGKRAIAGMEKLGMVVDFRKATQPLLQKTKAMHNSEKVELYQREKLPEVPVSTLVDHLEHVAKVAGVDHVCLGSDFDGAPMMPVGLEDVSRLPAITALLKQRGWTDENVRKVLGENVLRVPGSTSRPSRCARCPPSRRSSSGAQAAQERLDLLAGQQLELVD